MCIWLLSINSIVTEQKMDEEYHEQYQWETEMNYYTKTRNYFRVTNNIAAFIVILVQKR